MAKKPDSQRTTPFGLWRYGNDFRRAANYVLIQEQSKYFMPYYFLLGQSIELSLKAFLLGRGTELSTLRSRKYGHDLAALLTEAKRRKLGLEVALDSVDAAGIRYLSVEYAARKFQYIEVGMMTLPEASIVHETAEKLSVGLKSFCERATKP